MGLLLFPVHTPTYNPNIAAPSSVSIAINHGRELQAHDNLRYIGSQTRMFLAAWESGQEHVVGERMSVQAKTAFAILLYGGLPRRLAG